MKINDSEDIDIKKTCVSFERKICYYSYSFKIKFSFQPNRCGGLYGHDLS